MCFVCAIVYHIVFDFSCVHPSKHDCLPCILVLPVKDNYIYARVAKHLGDRTMVRDEQVEPLTEILGDEDAVSSRRCRILTSVLT